MPKLNSKLASRSVAPVRVPVFKKPRVSETKECRAFIDWTRLVRYLGNPLFDRVVKIPNERGKDGPATAILVSIGMRPGFQDYLIMAPRLAPTGLFYGGLLIEAKKVNGGLISTDQLYWNSAAVRFGYWAAFAAGAVELIRETRHYFELTGAVHDGSFIDRVHVQ